MLIALSRLLAVTAVLLTASATFATNQVFSDIRVTSRSEHFVFTAKSPQNDVPEGQRKPFASGFRYTLTDARRNEVVWSRSATVRNDQPRLAWVHDDGWAVIWTRGDMLFIFDPKGAQVGAGVYILDQFPPAERAEHVQLTTAGFTWDGPARWSFSALDGKPCFVLRTGWGRRVVVDLASGSAVADAGATIARQDWEWVLATLSTLVPRELASTASALEVSDLHDAIELAGLDKITEAVPMLRQAEASTRQGRVRSVSPPDKLADQPEGAVDILSYRMFTTRALAQHSLRMLGQSPSESSAIAFTTVGDGVNYTEIQPTKSEPREKTLARLSGGETAEQVLRQVGGPDRVRHGAVWIYHIQSGQPRTVRLTWSTDAPATLKWIDTTGLDLNRNDVIE